jgi:RNA polymerase-binding protein DksA
MLAVDVQRFRDSLLTERRRVLGAIENLHEENPGSLSDETGELVIGVDNHPADTATETFDRELEYTLEENSEHVLEEIDQALRRIDEGTFGICRTCGRPIPSERLEALPWATQCIDCRRRDERS